MSMPYHKELLRSSVSLCFREFFVFRNKAKGVMTLLCQFEKMIYPSGTGAADAASFMIALYRPCEKLKDSSGNTITQIKAVGYCLPTAGNMRYEMRGHWRKDPKYGIQYDVEGYEEQIIPTREGIIAYLSSGQIKGIGPKMAERIYDAFGNMALEVLDKKPEKLLTISGISQNKLKKICDAGLINEAEDTIRNLTADREKSLSSSSPREWMASIARFNGITELSREVVVTLIDKIYVYKDKHIRIDFNFRNELAYYKEILRQKEVS